MAQFNEILERIKTECMVDYLLTGTTNKVKKEHATTYNERINAAYEQFLNAIEQLVPDANKENDELLFLIADFFTKVTDIYMEIGLLTGLQFTKNLDHAYQKFNKTNKTLSHLLEWQ